MNHEKGKILSHKLQVAPSLDSFYSFQFLDSFSPPRVPRVPLFHLPISNFFRDLTFLFESFSLFHFPFEPFSHFLFQPFPHLLFELFSHFPTRFIDQWPTSLPCPKHPADSMKRVERWFEFYHHRWITIIRDKTWCPLCLMAAMRSFTTDNGWLWDQSRTWLWSQL